MKSALNRLRNRWLSLPILSSAQLRKLIRFAVWFFSGLVLPLSRIAGIGAPFSAALPAIAPFSLLFPSTLGTLLGELCWNGGLRFLSAATAILITAAIRWTLSEWKRLTSHPVFPPVLAGCTVFFSSFLLGGTLLTSSNLLPSVTRGLFAALAAYVFHATHTALNRRKPRPASDLQSTVLFSVTLGIFLLAPLSISLGGISLGRILLFLLILFFAVSASAPGGCIVGTAAGLLLLLSAGGSAESLLFAFTGLFCGFFSGIGRFAVAGSFLLSSGVSVLLLQSAPMFWVYESGIASILFLFLPQKTLERRIRTLFRPESESTPDVLHRSVASRLRFAADSIRSISSVADDISHSLIRTGAPSISAIYERAVEDVCTSCTLRLRCWEKEYSACMDALNRMTPSLLNRGFVSRSDLPEPFRTSCVRSGRLTSAISGLYENYIGNRDAEKRLAELKTVVSAQFRSVSDILGELSDSLADGFHTDKATEQEIRHYLSVRELPCLELFCRVDTSGRMCIELVLPRRTGSGFPSPALRTELRRDIGQLCGRNFGDPGISYTDSTVRLLLPEQPSFTVCSGNAFHACNGSSLCGDHYEFFPDGAGHVIAILSDGMGSGGRAAVDSSLTCGIFSRLICAGLGFDSTLRIINSALYTRSEEESLATLDVACLDLYSGTVQVLKAGAPVSYVRRAGTVSRIDLASLPAGILQEIRFSRGNIPLADGDILLLVSDGAVAEGDEWICETLRDWDGPVQELSDTVVQLALEKRSDAHDDDISAAALQIFAA